MLLMVGLLAIGAEHRLARAGTSQYRGAATGKG
jgi:hypothetical protein